MVEELERQHVQAVGTASGIEHITREHRIEIQTGEIYSHTAQHQEIVLRILRCLADSRISQQISERLHLPRVERRKIANAGWSVFAQRSSRNAHRIVVGLLFL